MAKGQKKSNRETRKPKQDKAKPASAASSVGAMDRAWPTGSRAKGSAQ